MTIQIIWAVLLILFTEASTFGYSEISPAVTSTSHATALLQTTESTPTASIQTESVPNIPYEKYTLKNGLEVILSEDHRLPLVSVNIWYHVGAANELPGHTGLAHLFEHLMFEGSKNADKQRYRQYLLSAGASSLSGYTSFDHTSYFETLPSNQIELALWLESDRMGSMLDVLDSEKLSIQQAVVRNERRQNTEHKLWELMEEGEYQALFPKDHPYFANIIGSHTDIESVNLDAVRDFAHHYYTPNNATIVIVGDINKDRLKQQIEKYFGSIPSGPPVAKVEFRTAPIKIRKHVFITARTRNSYLLMGWLTPPIYKAGDAEASITAKILGGGNTSRLYKALVVDKRLALNVHAEIKRLPLGSVLTVDAVAKNGGTQKQLEDAVNKVLAEFKQNGPTAEEINAARKAQKLILISRLERLGGLTGVSDVLNEDDYFAGDPGYSAQAMQSYNQVTSASVRGFLEKYLNSAQTVAVYGLSGKKQIDDVPRKAKLIEKNTDLKPENIIASSPFSSPTEIWRNTPPKPSPASPFMVNEPTKFKLQNGLTVYVVERHNLPTVALQVVARGGTDINPSSKAGLSLLTVDTLRRGTDRRSAEQFARELEQNSIAFTANSVEDHSWISTYGLTSSLSESFDLLSDAILHPTFAPKEMAKAKKTLRTSDEVGERILRRQLYGTKQAAGYDAAGTRKCIASISRSDSVECWRNLFVPRNSALVIAGDITSEQAKVMAERYFGGWKDVAPRPESQQAVGFSKQSIFVFDAKEAQQTSITVGSVGLSINSPDYAAANILNKIIGGLSSSRLNANLRSKHGYTYSISSRFNCYRHSGIFSLSCRVRSDETALALREILSEIEKIHKEPISDAEFNSAKNNWLFSRMANLETSQDAATYAKNLFIYHIESSSGSQSRIDATTLSDVEIAVKKYLDPKKMIIVLVGDKEKIEPELKKLDYGPILETDWMGKPYPPMATRTVIFRKDNF